MNLVKPADLAKIAGVSRQAIHDLIKKGKLPIDGNKNIDLDYPSVKKYLEERKERLGNEKKEPIKNAESIDSKATNFKKTEKKNIDKVVKGDIYNPETQIDIEEFKEAIGLTNLKTLSEIRLKEIDIRKKTLEEKIKRGDYIDRNTQAMLIFGYMEVLNKRMLNFPVQIIDRIIAMSMKDGIEARGKIVTLWTTEISKLLKSAKRDCKNTFEKNIFKEQKDENNN